ncbi:MAG: SUMF1/EgtB/PvdO family nonheme iron enzyme [Spirochaetota bacterium]
MSVSKAKELVEIEKLTGLEFLFIPKGSYTIGKTKDLAFLHSPNKYSRYDFFAKEQVELSGFYISKTVFHLSHWKQLYQSSYKKKLQKILSEEERNSYCYNFNREVSYGVFHGYQKIEKDFQENDPVFTLSPDAALELASLLGLALPNYQQWEVASRGNDSWCYPGGNEISLQELKTKKYPFAYYWEDPESTMGYRDSETVKGYKLRLQDLENLQAKVSPFGLSDLVTFAGEWNRSGEEYIFRSFLDTAFAKAGVKLSDDAKQSEALEKSNHRSFCGLPLFAYGKQDCARVAGFRLLFQELHKPTLAEKPIYVETRPDVKLYAFLGEPMSRVLEYVGEAEKRDSHDFSTGAAVSFSDTYYYYKRGMVLESSSRFGKLFLPSASKKVSRLSEITFKADVAKTLTERHYFSAYGQEVFPGYSLGNQYSESEYQKLQQFAEEHGLKLSISRSSENYLNSVRLSIDFDNQEKLFALKYQEGVWQKETLRFHRYSSSLGHNYHVSEILYAKESDTIVSAGKDSLLCLWKLGSSIPTRTFQEEGYQPAYTAMCFAESEDVVLLGNGEGKVIEQNLSTGAKLIHSVHTKEVLQIQFLPPQYCITSSEDDFIHCYDLKDQKIVYSIKADFVLKTYPFAVAANRDELVDGASAWVYRASTGEQLYRLPEELSDFGITNLLFTPQEDRLLLCYSNELVLLDFVEQKILYQHKIAEGYDALSESIIQFFAGGKKFFTAGNNFINVYDTESGQRLQYSKSYPTIATAARMLEKQKILVTGAFTGAMPVLSTKTKVIKMQRFLGSGKSLLYSICGDATFLCYGDSDGMVFFLDLATNEQIAIQQMHSSSVTSLQVLPGNRLLSGSWDGTVKIWNASRELEWSHKTKDWVIATTYLAGKQAVLFATRKGSLFAVRVSDSQVLYQEKLQLQEYGGDFTGFAWSHSQEQLVYYCKGGLVLSSPFADTQSVHRELQDTGECFVFSPDDAYVFVGTVSGKIYQYRREGLQLLRVLDGHLDTVSTLSIQGSFLLSAGKEEAAVLWDWSTGQKLASTKHSSGGITPACFLEERKVAICSSSSVHLYELLGLED